MKKSFSLFLSLALSGAVALNANTITGTLSVNGVTASDDATVELTTGSNGLYNFVLTTASNGTITMSDVPAATVNGITVLYAQQNGNTLLARFNADNMLTADVTTQNAQLRFDNVGDYFQLPNSDLETWTASNGEPDRWHGFMTAKGPLASFAATGGKLASSNDVRPGTAGQYSAVITTGSVLNSKANGTMTNGQLNAGGITADDTKNHAEMDKTSTNTDASGEKFYMPIYAKPDAFKSWVKYVPANSSDKANVSVKTFDGTYYQEPPDKTYTNLSGSIVGGQIEACDWTEFTFPFDYDSYAGNNAATEAIFVTFSTNATPGAGTEGDAVYIDDMELIYLASISDLQYHGVTLEGFDAAVTEYTINSADEPNLDDFTATVNGASAVLAKSLEQTADGYRVVISVVSADLQTAIAYVINFVADSYLLGDVNGDGSVDITDVTVLIDYLLSGDATGVNLNAADVDESGSVDISDVTRLIDYLLSGN